MSCSDARTYTGRRRWLYAPLLVAGFFVLVEILLALVGVEPPNLTRDPYVGFSGRAPMFVRATAADGSTRLQLAPAKRRLFNPQGFALDKADGGYRIFCLGGSTTYGHPYDQRVAFCGWLQAYLQAAQPQRQWQVINLGGISYASYRVAAMMAELRDYAPDLFVVYSGHNEFLEERSYRQIIAIPAWVRELNLALGQSRLYGLIRQGLEAGSAPAGADPGAETGADRTLLPAEVDEILNHTVGPESYQRDDARSAAIGEHYRYNLQRMIELARAADSEILFVQPAAKLREESPFKSVLADGVDAQRWRRWFDRGRQALADRDAEAALAALDQALALDERHAHSHYLRGEALFALGRFAAARAALQRSLDEDVAPLRMPGSLQQILREVTMEQGVTLIDYPGLLAAESRRRLGHDLPGDLLFLDHVHPIAQMHGRLALALFAELQARGVVEPGPDWNAAQIEQVDKQRLATLDTDMQRTALLTLAAVVGWGGKLEEAHRLLLRSRAEFGDTPALLSRLVKSAGRQGRPQAALQFAEQAVAAYPTRFQAWVDLGNVHADLQHADAAAQAYAQALVIDPDALAIRHERAVQLQLLGRLPAAIAEFQAILERDPDQVDTRVNLGVLRAGLGELAQAQDDLKAALLADPDHAYAHYVLAVILEQLQRDAEALPHYRRSRALNPDDPEVANGLGVALARQGRIAAAIQAFEAALALQPDHADARRNLARARAARP